MSRFGLTSAEREPGRLAHLFAAGRAGMRSAFRATVDLVLPPLCPCCRVTLQGEGGVCQDCWHGLSFLERPWCDRLGTPMSLDLGDGVVSAAAVAHPPLFRRARSALVYDGRLPDLVRSFKYGDRTDLAPMFTGWMDRVAAELVTDCDAVVPVPLHWSRLIRRRYNQAALLALPLGRRHGLAYRPDLLVRARRTRQQVGLNRQERDRNIRNAFAVPARRRTAVAGQRILLVDDVMTTGATIDSAVRTLLAAGATAVDVLTLARVVEDGTTVYMG